MVTAPLDDSIDKLAPDGGPGGDESNHDGGGGGGGLH